MGHKVQGIFMWNWDEQEERGVCSADKDYEHVQKLCDGLGIPCSRVDFVQEYWTEVFSTLLDAYNLGATPNPDVLCNHRIKFDVFLRHAKTLGAEYLATGHYARTAYDRETGRSLMLTAADESKDQTFFLGGLPGTVLNDVLFPIGHLRKEEVREEAVEAGLLDVAQRKESMGLCFVGKRRFADFIGGYLDDNPGDIIHVRDSSCVGTHPGLFRYTIGQRAKIGSLTERLFVVGKNMSANQLVVGPGDHPSLTSMKFCVDRVAWTAGKAPAGRDCLVRYRHQQGRLPARLDLNVQEVEGQPPNQPLEVSSFGMDSVGFVPGCDVGAAYASIKDVCLGRGGVQVTAAPGAAGFRSVAPGQTAVIYHGNVCLGAGTIAAALPSSTALPE